VEKANASNPGPAFFSEDIDSLEDVSYAHLPDKLGYVHLRRCKETLIEQFDTALAELEGIHGLVLDFRGNSGGGHFDELMERLIPKGQELAFGRTYKSSGEHPFGGPVVVIIDAGVVSAGETMCGMLKDDGRACLIGDSPTAGMSSQEKTIELPSGFSSLVV
jgi:carboxyl-terminal processing protease